MTPEATQKMEEFIQLNITAGRRDLYKAGRESLKAELEGMSGVEFDEEASWQASGDFEIHPSDGAITNDISFKFGARWQHQQSQLKIAALKQEVEELKSLNGPKSGFGEKHEAHRYRQIHEAVNKMGGWANYSTWAKRHSVAYFQLCEKLESKLQMAVDTIANAEKYLTSCGYKDKGALQNEPEDCMVMDFQKTLAKIKGE